MDKVDELVEWALGIVESKTRNHSYNSPNPIDGGFELLSHKELLCSPRDLAKQILSHPDLFIPVPDSNKFWNLAERLKENYES